MLKIKSGSKGAKLLGLTPQMALAAFVVEGVYARYGVECTLTENAPTVAHGVDSLHNSGNALDFATSNLPPTSHPILRDSVKRALGDEFDVVLEDDHLHVEWQP